jgi:hypothetical protein
MKGATFNPFFARSEEAEAGASFGSAVVLTGGCATLAACALT